jgi:hypothetical protein
MHKLTFGKYSSNLFFQKKQEYSTWYAALVSIAGVIIITILSIYVIQDIIDQKTVTVAIAKLDET